MFSQHLTIQISLNLITVGDSLRRVFYATNTVILLVKLYLCSKSSK